MPTLNLAKKSNQFLRIPNFATSFHDMAITFGIRNNSGGFHFPKCCYRASIHMKLVIASHCRTKGQHIDFLIRFKNLKQSLNNFEFSSPNSTANQFRTSRTIRENMIVLKSSEIKSHFFECEQLEMAIRFERVGKRLCRFI